VNVFAIAERLRPVLAKEAFARVFISPMQRARETCELAGLGTAAVVDPDLGEWNYGEYEGLTPKQIQEKAPGWLISRDGCLGGDTPERVGARVDRHIAGIPRGHHGCLHGSDCAGDAVPRGAPLGDGAIFAHRPPVASCPSQRRRYCDHAEEQRRRE
jgi:hypothetical protein